MTDTVSVSTRTFDGLYSWKVMVPVGLLPPERTAVSLSLAPLPMTTVPPATVLIAGVAGGGGGGVGTFPASVAALATGAMKPMVLSKLKRAALAAIIGLATTGAVAMFDTRSVRS